MDIGQSEPQAKQLNTEGTLRNSFHKLLSVEDELENLLSLSNELRRNMEGIGLDPVNNESLKCSVQDETTVVGQFDILSSRLSSLILKIYENNVVVLKMIG